MADADFHVDDDVCNMEDDDGLIFTPETLEAIEEAERLARDPNAKRYTDIDELMKDLLADD